MNAKSQIKEEVKRNEQKIGKLKKELENWKKDVLEDNKREERRKELEIERVKQEFENSKEQMNTKEKVFDDQIKAVEQALNSIEEISKTSLNIQS